MTLSNQARDRVKGAFEPIALALGRLGLTPDALTLIGFLITAVGAALLAAEQWLPAGLVVFAGGSFDLFDGTLARATGKVSRWGAFLDSTLDRAGETLVYLGVVVGLTFAGFREGAILAAAALGSALMVSYVRSKSEGLGFTDHVGMAAVGIMPREVRLVILTVGLILAPLPIYEAVPPNAACAGACDFPQGGSLTLALAIIVAGALTTTIQRILHVRRQSITPAVGRSIEQEQS